MVDKNAVEDFLDAIKQPEKTTNNTYSAVVTRIDDKNIVWVQIAGSDKETPTSSTSSEVKRGDSVNVQWRNNRLYISGNYSNPSAGVTRVANVETTAQVANQAAQNAVADAGIARDAAESAQASATAASTAATNAQTSADSALVSLATVEDVVGVLNWITAHGTMTLTSDVAVNPDHVYFVVDPAGDYEVGGAHYSIVSEPKLADIGTYYELSVDESVQNYVITHLAVNTEGLWIIPDQYGTPTTNGKKILIATGAGSTYTTAGTYIIDRSSGVDKIMASFRSDGATIGENANGKSRTEISATGMQIIRNVSGTDTQIANLGYGSGNNEQGTTSNAPYYSLGERIGDVGNYSVAEGSNVVAKSFATHAEGRANIASGEYSHAEGTKTSARGAASHSEGNSNHGTVNIVDGVSIPVIGGIDASGQGAHAEGYAVNNSSWDIKASGDGSHAEGYADGTHGHITASGKGSHAQNCGTVAASDYQTAIGVCNVEDNNNTYALIVGNGTSNNARSNALTVDWSGNVNIASGANYKINGTNLLDIFYPVGSYYETSNTSFNPNASWGGTWVLETAGMVHVSGGTGYTVSKANNNSGAGAQDGGSADAIVVSHSHGTGTLSGSTPTLTASNSNYITAATAPSSLRGSITSSTSSSYNYVRVDTSGASMSRSAPTIASGKTVTISGSTASEGSSGTGANMQPYINVNRWHRTA